MDMTQASSRRESSAIDTVGSGADATGHTALCITEELWTLCGIDGADGLVMSLAKVLTSLPLPDDDQVLCSYSGTL